MEGRGQSFYHCPKSQLNIGMVLEPRFYLTPFDALMIPTMLSALEESPLVVKGLLKADPLVDLLVEKLEENKGNWIQGVLLEAVFEKVRGQSFPEWPTRIGGIFLCPSIEDCRKYGRSFNRSTVWRCEVVGKVSRLFDLNLVWRAEPHRPVEEQLAYFTVR